MSAGLLLSETKKAGGEKKSINNFLVDDLQAMAFSPLTTFCLCNIKDKTV